MSEHARLADRVRTRGPLSPDDTARLLLPVADGLARAHAEGRHHGRISPAAVLIDAHGRASLADAGQAAPDPAYTPPDPSRGLHRRADADDVWALAAVLRTVVTGREVDDTTVARDLGWLAPLVELCLRSDPRERPSAHDAADYLRRARMVETGPGGPRRGMVLGLAGAALVLGLGVLGGALLLGGGTEETDPTADEPTTGAPTTGAPTSAPQPQAPTSTATAAEAVPAEQLEAFARDYVRTASTDPAAGFALLTRAYQAASPRYEEFWSGVTAPRITRVDGDPESLTVSYTYQYGLPAGSSRTEDVVLRLTLEDDRLLIAGASARNS